MLGNTDAVATLAVKDLDVAARFYETMLGLNRVGAEGDETWTVDDVEDVVRTLKGKGVSEGDVHVAGDVKVAWFKDPDGNILSIVNR